MAKIIKERDNVFYLFLQKLFDTYDDVDKYEMHRYLNSNDVELDVEYLSDIGIGDDDENDIFAIEDVQEQLENKISLLEATDFFTMDGIDRQINMFDELHGYVYYIDNEFNIRRVMLHAKEI